MYPAFADTFWNKLEVTFNLRDADGGLQSTPRQAPGHQDPQGFFLNDSQSGAAPSLSISDTSALWPELLQQMPPSPPNPRQDLDCWPRELGFKLEQLQAQMNRLESRVSSDLSRILQLLQHPQGRPSYILGASASSDLASFPETSVTRSSESTLLVGHVPSAQTLSYGDLDDHIQTPRNFSPRTPHVAMAMDKTLVPSSEQEQPGGLLSPLASPLSPLEVQGLGGSRFPSLPEHLSSVPKQLEFQRHGSDPGFTRS